MPWISSQLSRNGSATAFWLAAFNHSIANASNSAVNRPNGSAHGNFTTRTPCSVHSLRGGSACRIVWYWQVCPDAAIGAPVDDRAACCPLHIPDTANSAASGGPDGRGALRRPTSTQPTRRTKATRSRECADKGLDLAFPELSHALLRNCPDSTTKPEFPKILLIGKGRQRFQLRNGLILQKPRHDLSAVVAERSGLVRLLGFFFA